VASRKLIPTSAHALALIQPRRDAPGLAAIREGTVDDDLVQFLRDRYDEEAARAQRAVDGPRNAFVSADEDVEPLLFDDDGEFVLPARVLRDIEARQHVVRECAELLDEDAPGVGTSAERMLRALAAVYADHPGYRGEWRP
jgi:hypothetical protein